MQKVNLNHLFLKNSFWLIVQRINLLNPDLSLTKYNLIRLKIIRPNQETYLLIKWIENSFKLKKVWLNKNLISISILKD